LTNGYLPLVPVVFAIAGDLGVPGAVKVDTTMTPEQAYEGKDNSTWAVMARTEADPLPVQNADGWWLTGATGEAIPSEYLWTDDRSNLVDLLFARRSQ
jgi:hypothetical protein